jgi:phosphate transport system permease protein
MERGVSWLLALSTYFVLCCAAFIFYDIGSKGGAVIFQKTAPFINVPFLTEAPETLYVFEFEGRKITMGDRAFRQFKAGHEAGFKGVRVESYVYSAGGIFPNIAGTVLLVAGSMIIALILGVLSAIYLNEYALDGPFIRFLRLSIVNLAGVPSIVFGLFGFGLFVIALDFGVSLLAGWLTMAFMVLPIIITASEEALKAVPRGYREGSLALGATKFQTILTNVLPYALPGILTSSVLSIARVAGETAPIMFTAAFVMRDELPWQVQKWTDFLFQGVMALPYHIYVVASKIPQNEYTRDVQYGTAFVFLFTVAAIAMTAVILRQRLRKKYQW